MSKKSKKNSLLTPKENTQYVDAYHYTLNAVESFARLSPNIPSVFLKIVRNIYGRFDVAAYSIFDAANTYDNDKKIEDLNKAKNCLFYQFASLELIVKGRGLTIGAANEVLIDIKHAYENVNKWLSYLMKG